MKDSGEIWHRTMIGYLAVCLSLAWIMGVWGDRDWNRDAEIRNLDGGLGQGVVRYRMQLYTSWVQYRGPKTETGTISLLARHRQIGD
jgi:hypothetical protein